MLHSLCPRWRNDFLFFLNVLSRCRAPTVGVQYQIRHPTVVPCDGLEPSHSLDVQVSNFT